MVEVPPCALWEVALWHCRATRALNGSHLSLGEYLRGSHWGQELVRGAVLVEGRNGTPPKIWFLVKSWQKNSWNKEALRHPILAWNLVFCFELMTPSIVLWIIFGVGFSIFQELVDDPRLAVVEVKGSSPRDPKNPFLWNFANFHQVATGAYQVAKREGRQDHPHHHHRRFQRSLRFFFGIEHRSPNGRHDFFGRQMTVSLFLFFVNASFKL